MSKTLKAFMCVLILNMKRAPDEQITAAEIYDNKLIVFPNGQHVFVMVTGANSQMSVIGRFDNNHQEAIEFAQRIRAQIDEAPDPATKRQIINGLMGYCAAPAA